MDRSTRPLSRASSAVLNVKAGTRSLPSAAATKRKRADFEADASSTISRDRIVIKPFTESASQQQQPDLELQPCQTVSRLQVPLIYLDTSPARDVYPRLFRGRITALEEAPPTEQLLIAEDWASGRLFAIESVQEDIHALCGLQPWVTLADLGRHVKTRRTHASCEPYAKVERWWEPVSPPMTKVAPAANEALIGLRRRFSMKPKPTALQPDCSMEQSTKPANEVSQQPQEPVPAKEVTSNAVLQDDVSSAELLAAIKTHYLDSLYIHRTPLAYFVKGPLSRAKSGVRQDAAPNLLYQELIEFLRLHIMTLTMGNKKYNDTLGEVIREIPVGVSLDEIDNQATTPLKDRIRKSKKRKHLSKGGLLPGEEDYVVRWWVKCEATSEYHGEDDTRESRIKTGLVDQRARETQLQIILILETLALEAVVAREGPDSEHADPTADTEEPAKKKKKPVDLNNVLDVLIDRLCIWESMNLDAPKSSKTSKDASRKVKPNQKEPESDCLRDFCTDIVVPYYATRLPELYISICQKLGGPDLASSPPVMRTPAPKKMVKPGAAVSRAAPPKKDKKAIQESGLSKRAPAPLARSATDSQLPSLKRELSQVDISNVPRHRPSLQQSRRYSQREVDLPAAAAATEVRLARKAAAEQELKSAIAALRKPNARLAVKDFVDSAEQHAAARATKGRKSKQPTRNPFATAVQVTATPKINRQARHRTAYTLPPPAPVLAHAASQPVFSEVVPPSSESRVPSSSMKAASTQPHPDLAQTPLPQRYIAVDATPSRKRAKVVPARRPSTSLTSGVPEVLASVAEIGSSPQLPPPLQRTPEAAFKRPMVPDSAVRPVPRKQAALDAFYTPVKAPASVNRVKFAMDMIEDEQPAQEHVGTPIADGDDCDDGNENPGESEDDDDEEDEDVDVVQLVSSTPAKQQEHGPIYARSDENETEGSHSDVPALTTTLTSTPTMPSIAIAIPTSTPVRPHAPGLDLAAHGTSEPVDPPQPEPEPDIYAMLGWNDDFDDDNDLAF